MVRDRGEFMKALSLWSATAENGLPGSGGLPSEVVHGLFDRYDTSGDGQVDYNEFCAAIVKDVPQDVGLHKML